MKSEWTERAWFRWAAVFVLLFAFYSLPCLPLELPRIAQEGSPEAQESYAPQNGRGGIIVLPISETADANKEHPYCGEKCSGWLVCSIVWPRLDRFAERTLEEPIAFFTVILAISTIGLLLQTKRLAEGAKDQIELTDKLFMAEHRPWVSVQFKRQAPFTWSQNEDDPVPGRTRITLRVENQGNSPAHNVMFAAELWHAGRVGTDRSNQIAQWFKPTIIRTDTLGQTIFPNGRAEFLIDLFLDLPRVDIDRAAIQPAPTQPAPFIVFGCVVYLDSHSRQFHATRFTLFMTQMKTPLQGGFWGAMIGFPFARHIGDVDTQLLRLEYANYGNQGT